MLAVSTPARHEVHAMPQFPFQIVGFDLDGTLCDTAADLGAAINHALAQAGRPDIPQEAVAGLIGGGSRLMLQRALELTGGADGMDEAALYRVMLDRYSADIAVHTRPYPGCTDALEALAQRGVRLAVVTNKPQALADKLLDALDMARHFALIIGRGAPGIAQPKPAADPLLAMVARLGGGAAAYVGDSSFDTRAARAAALPVIVTSFGFNDQPVNELGADAIIDHYDGLVPALLAL